MSRVVKAGKLLALSAAALVVLAFLGKSFVAWRESAFPWTDRGGPHWATLHVQNDSSAPLAFQHLLPGKSDLERGAGEPRRDVGPGERGDAGIVVAIHGAPVDDGGPAGAVEVGCMLHLADDQRVLFPLVLRVGDHVLVRVHPDGRVTTSPGEQSLIGRVSFGEEHAVAHAPPPGPPWRSFVEPLPGVGKHDGAARDR